MVLEIGGNFPYSKDNLRTSWAHDDRVRLKKAKLLYYPGDKRWVHELGTAMDECIWYDKEGYSCNGRSSWLIKLPTILRKENVNGFDEGGDTWI